MILRGLSFDVKRGEIYGVIGPNGCGKTVMLNALTGLIFPIEGSIIYDGRDIGAMPPHKRCQAGIGRTFQIPRPFEGMTVQENVEVASLYGAGRNKEQSREEAGEILKCTGLYDKKDMRSGELTLLDRKRLEVARAMGTGPGLLLLDETAAGLSDAETGEIKELIGGLRNDGISFIWIEHILDVIKDMADRLMCMSEGQNMITGTPDDVLGSRLVEELYLGADNG